jgi:hypothetical protein
MKKQKQFLVVSILMIIGYSSCKKTDAQSAPVVITPVSAAYYQVKARANSLSTSWGTYTAKTIDKLPGFTYTIDPELNAYGSWKVNQATASGYFRVEKKGDRWWIVDPDGYPFIHKGVAVFTPGGSTGQKAALASKYGSTANWATQESQLLRDNGFNGVGAWSNVDAIRQSPKPLVYTVIVNPMGAYKAQDVKKYPGGVYPAGTYGWQGYRYDLAMVFDPQFDTYIESSIATIAQYTLDKNLLGYFTDNELPWKNDALDRHLKYLTATESGYIAAKNWLDARKGFSASITDVNDADRLAFTGFYFETYIKKVSAAIRKYDPNHLYLGCRFNQESEELNNSEMFKMAGKYMDVVSINHYRKWEPVQSIMVNWTTWSGKPFIITEWYTKGEDSGLPNNTGAGWNVPTQADRGYFYQNFTIELLKSKACVGWHWFTYQDNDPLDLTTDPSNRDSNKGIVNSLFVPYSPLMSNIKILNTHVYELINYLDK